jgi:PAS domain S-box-containing protein
MKEDLSTGTQVDGRGHAWTHRWNISGTATARHTIGVRFISLVVAAAVLAGTVVGIVTISTSRDAQYRDILDDNADKAQLIAKLTSSYMAAARTHAVAFASRTDVRQAVLSDTAAQLQPVLDWFVAVQSAMESAGILDANGIQVASRFAISTSIGQSFSDRDYFEQVVATGQPYLGSPVKSRVSGKAVTTFAVPILDDQAQLRGVLICAISLANLSDTIVQAESEQDTRSSIIDLRNGGSIVADRDSALLLAPVSNGKEAISRLQAGRTGAIRSSESTGEGDLIGFATVPDLPWGVMVVTPVKTADALVSRLTRQAGLLTGLIVLLMAIVGGVLMLRIVRPLHRLIEGIREIGRGNLGHEVATEAKDEVGDLSRAFGDMAADLRKTLVSRDALAIEVDERMKAEEELRRGELRLREAQALGRIGSWEFDLDTQAISWSDETYVLYERDPRLGSPSPEEETRYYSSEQAKTLLDLSSRAIETGETLAYDLEVSLPSGRTAWYSSVMQPLRDAEGRICKLCGTVQDITGRRSSEAALRQSEGAYRQLAESISDVFFALDWDMNYTYWNKACEHLTGIPAAAALGRHFLDIFPDNESTRDLQRLYVEAMQTGQPQRVTASYPGDHRLVHEITAHPSPGGVSVVVKDVTERERVAEELAIKARLLDAASDGILIHDQDGHISYANEAAAMLHGYAKQELENVNLRTLVVPPEDKHFADRIEAVYQTGTTLFRVEHYRKDGSIRPFEVLAQSIVVQGKRQIMSVLRDISQRTKDEEALRFSDTALKSLHEAVFAVDDNAIVTHWNNICESLFGIKAADAIGKRITESFSIVEDYPGQNQERIKLLRARGYNREEQVYRCPRGDVWLDVHSQAIESGGKRMGWVYLALDITASKQAEEERARLEEKAQLNSRLAAVGEMAAGIAHEINNPLTGVIGFSKLLLERDNIPEHLREELGIIADGSQRVADIVKRLLTFARQTKPMRTAASINELIDNTLKLRAYVLRTANIEVSMRLDPELPWSVVDPGQLQQVFMNLIVNAEQAMKEAHGKGFLVITTEKKGSNIRISFQDDGPGIGKDNMKRLFEPFFTTKEVGQGTGLGLSLSRSIVLEHGGGITVESEPGHGAIFTVELPIAESLAPGTGVASPPAKAEPAHIRKSTVLVIDDEHGIRQLAKNALTGNGYVVDTASDARTALDTLIAGARYDAIFTDIRMPGMSGMELYEHLVDQVPAMASRMIFITGDSMGVDVTAFLNQHSLPCLTKPFGIEALRKATETAMMGARQSGFHEPGRGVQ